MDKKYQITKEECQERISGVCEGCGGNLEPIETVNNADEPTFWVGCRHCMCFRSGVKRIYWEIARQLVESEKMLPYRYHPINNSPEELDYYYDRQTAGLSRNIALIHKLLKEKMEI